VDFCIDELNFSSPVKIDEFDYDDRKGIYIILYEKHPSNSNLKNFKIAYIGITKDVSKRHLPWNHHKIDDMIKVAGNRKNLYISFYNMPHSSSHTRTELERKLVGQYKPPCNDYLLNGEN
jgi:hypothetical protein